MSLFKIRDQEFESLKDKHIVITGGSTGIGRSVVLIALQFGANLTVGDVNEDQGESLRKQAAEDIYKGKLEFVKVDVTSWEDQLNLFKTAVNRFGDIDGVIANAGVFEQKSLIEDELDDSGNLKAPSLKVLDINLRGQLYTTKLARYYMLKNRNSGGALVITGSAASFLDSPPLYVYSTSKGGAIALKRSLHSVLIKENITTNIICPGVTRTSMTVEILKEWGDLPVNTAEDVARALLLPVVRRISGCTLVVAGGKIFDIEEKLKQTKPLWMSQELSDYFDEGERRVVRSNLLS